ncbi:DMT family transporter [Pseudomonas typographi]|uniref:DMT family transporter n=1 Tax=Pseudomonas typographi TaxID=2715964 RepID=A0ABR7Z1F1_9PSED|nr:DMT family transporter [Pseudomonas typographi]MBD1551653.1 DMT family transporter [Pseudomonas typographi]MBD1587093.1 DMT family transporter [Pseudomonas typographi]MBD1599329.1 DMT family transporter [Pseudomonas typographi]
MSQRSFWLLALIAVTAVWGWSFVAKHESLAGLSASALNAWLFIVAAVALFPFAKRSLLRLPARGWACGISAGAVLFIAFLLQTSGMAYTTASNAGFITGLCSVFVPLILCLAGRGRPRARQLIGMLIALCGLGFLSLEGFTLHIGDLLILGCAVAFAVHVVVLSAFAAEAPPQVSAFLQLATAGLLSLGWSVAMGECSLPRSMSATLTLLVIALLGTALGFYIQTRAQAVIPPQQVAWVLMCEPVFSGVFGYLLAGDRLTTGKAIGATLVLVGIVASELRTPPRRAQRPLRLTN